MPCLPLVSRLLRAQNVLAHMLLGYSAGMEFVLALLPWRVIWKLQMKRKEKFGVAVAMSMGIL
jgi:hypothetical protein